MHYILGKKGLQKSYYGHCTRYRGEQKIKKLNESCKFFTETDFSKEEKLKSFKETLTTLSERIEYLAELIGKSDEREKG